MFPVRAFRGSVRQFCAEWNTNRGKTVHSLRKARSRQSKAMAIVGACPPTGRAFVLVFGLSCKTGIGARQGYPTIR